MTNSSPTIVRVGSAEQLAAVASVHIEDAILRTVERSGRCTIALAGGNTPRGVYEQLKRLSRIPWRRIQIYFGDERCVPPDHPASNYHMADVALLAHVDLDPSQVHRMHGEMARPEEAAELYEAVLPPQLDLLLLGVGADGHTASLFPGSGALDESRRRVVHAVSPVPPTDRITITPLVLDRAAQRIVLATGADKAQAVASALLPDTDPHKTPARLAMTGIWIVDQHAARLLPEQ